MNKVCKICGKEFESPNADKLTCSVSCSRKLGAITRKIKGNDNFSSPEFRQKSRETKMKKYGDPNYCNKLKANETKAKRTEEQKRESNLKSRKTRLERYGSETYNNQEAREETFMKKYGCKNSMQSEIVKQKSRDTCMKHYNCNYFVESKESKAIIKKALKDKYNVSGITQLNFTDFQKEVLNDRDKFLEEIHKIKFEDRIMRNLTEYFGINRAQISWRINKWNIDNKLFPFSKNTTNPELEVLNLIRSKFNIDNYKLHCRSLIRDPITNHCLELDIYFPDYKVAIEYNGFYWHDKNNQKEELLKVDLCNNLGINLIHIWEDDWYQNRDEVMIKLYNAFNLDLFDEIESVEEIEVENTDVYDIEVPGYNNFVLSNGLVVHNSSDTKQSLITMGFEDVKIVSLDKSPDGYLTYKNVINEQRIAHLHNELLEFEIINLNRDNQTGKIDHDLDKCFTGDTKIKLLDGRDLTILELMKEQEYRTNYVYTFNENKKIIEPKRIKKVFQTMITKNLVKVTLDNGESIKCTPNHRFMLRDGTYKIASELSEGTSLMPLDEDRYVISIELLSISCEVYDIEVEDNHNFALSAGVIVHNSKDISDSLAGAVYNASLHEQELNLYLMDANDITLDINDGIEDKDDKDTLLDNLIANPNPTPVTRREEQNISTDTYDNGFFFF